MNTTQDGDIFAFTVTADQERYITGFVLLALRNKNSNS